MVLPSLYSSDSGGNLSSSNSISSTSKKDQTFLLRKLSLWYRTYNSRSRFYRLTVGGLFFILVWLTICIIWRKIALDYELQRGAVLFRNLYPAPPSESSLGTKTTFPSSSSSPSSSVISPDLPIIPILIPVYSRPEYLQRVITSLKNVHNINQTVLVFSQDGRLPEITALINQIDFAPVIHLYHSPPYFNLPSYILRTDMPTAANVYFLLQFAFEYNTHIPAAIILESDIQLSVDGYDYFRWAYEQVRKDTLLRSKVLTINGYYEPSVATNSPYQFSIDEYGFMVWGWLCPSWSYPDIRQGWTWFHNWDITVEESIRQPLHKVSLSPLVSRTKNIGMKGINFDIQDPQEIHKWENLYISNQPINFDGQTISIVDTKAKRSKDTKESI